MFFCQASAGRTADLYGFELAVIFQSAADIKDNFSQSGSHRNFNQTCIFNGAGQGEGLCSRASLGTDAAIPVGTIQQDLRYIGKCFYVIQDGRFFPESFFNGTRRFYTRHTTISFDGCSQGRTFTTYECAGTTVDVHMEAEICTQDVVSQKSFVLQLCDGVTQTFYRVRILCTHIDITILCFHSVGGNHHTFNQTIGITFHNGTIHKCSRVSLVAVTYYETCGFFLTGYLFPLFASRETAASTASQSGLINFIDNLVWCHIKQCFFQCQESAARQILFKGFCFQLSTVLQYETGLFLNKRNVFRCLINLSFLFVQKAFYYIISFYTSLENFFAVIQFYFCILDNFIAFLDTNQWSEFTDTLASCFLYAQLIFVLLCIMGRKFQSNARGVFADFHKLLINLLGSCSDTSGS